MRARSALLPLLLLGMPAALAGQPQSHPQPGPPPRHLEVVGEAEIDASPEVAELILAVETEAAEAAAAAAANAERSERVLAAVRRLLGEGDEVTTTGYSLHPRYDHREPAAEPRIVGYTASNQVRVETRRLEAVGELIDAAIAAGANRVDGLQFTLEDRSPRKREALAVAAADARARAAALAGALGVTLGPVLAATAGEVSRPGPPVPYARAMAVEESLATTPVEPGTVKVRATVQVRFAISGGESPPP